MELTITADGITMTFTGDVNDVIKAAHACTDPATRNTLAGIVTPTDNTNTVGDWYATRPRSNTDNRATIHRMGCNHRAGDFITGQTDVDHQRFAEILRAPWGVTGAIDNADCC